MAASNSNGSHHAPAGDKPCMALRENTPGLLWSSESKGHLSRACACGLVATSRAPHSVYLSKTKHALVPPKPKELDMTRFTSPSWRLVRMFMPSASSTWLGLGSG